MSDDPTAREFDAIELVLGGIQMIPRGVSYHRHPGEGRDPFPRWAPAFAGVTEFFGGSIGPASTNESSEWI